MLTTMTLAEELIGALKQNVDRRMYSKGWTVHDRGRTNITKEGKLSPHRFIIPHNLTM